MRALHQDMGISSGIYTPSNQLSFVRLSVRPSSVPQIHRVIYTVYYTGILRGFAALVLLDHLTTPTQETEMGIRITHTGIWQEIVLYGERNIEIRLENLLVALPIGQRVREGRDPVGDDGGVPTLQDNG